MVPAYWMTLGVLAQGVNARLQRTTFVRAGSVRGHVDEQNVPGIAARIGDDEVQVRRVVAVRVLRPERVSERDHASGARAQNGGEIV
jgi:hypothetical protein